ncbi:DNA-deoxyinosine glycosylase [Oenococcus alcoholitolerans]|uniref:DNA-deoxyinosine glycosylase n=1 Tax=Oenococcus alcoholitolerans TaxID=931074 RepID=UPI003F71756E
MAFFYGSPQNLFWPTLAKVLGKKEPLPEISSRRQFALQNHIAIWVTLKEADIVGSKDATIENPVVNDFSELMQNSDIQYIFTEGKKSTELFKTFAAEQVGIEPIYLPSASPANRAQQKKPIYLERWSLIKKAIDGLL